MAEASWRDPSTGNAYLSELWGSGLIGMGAIEHAAWIIQHPDSTPEQIDELDLDGIYDWAASIIDLADVETHLDSTVAHKLAALLSTWNDDEEWAMNDEPRADKSDIGNALDDCTALFSTLSRRYWQARQKQSAEGGGDQEHGIPLEHRTKTISLKYAAALHAGSNVPNPSLYIRRLWETERMKRPAGSGQKWVFDIRDFPTSKHEKLR